MSPIPTLDASYALSALNTFDGGALDKTGRREYDVYVDALLQKDCTSRIVTEHLLVLANEVASKPSLAQAYCALLSALPSLDEELRARIHALANGDTSGLAIDSRIFFLAILPKIKVALSYPALKADREAYTRYPLIWLDLVAASCSPSQIVESATKLFAEKKLDVMNLINKAILIRRRFPSEAVEILNNISISMQIDSDRKAFIERINSIYGENYLTGSLVHAPRPASGRQLSGEKYRVILSRLTANRKASPVNANAAA